jgi:hypothetical protein
VSPYHPDARRIAAIVAYAESVIAEAVALSREHRLWEGG